MARANGRHNLGVLEQAIEDWLAGSAGTRSRGEVAFRRAIAALGLPRPLTNMKVCIDLAAADWTILRCKAYEIAVAKLRTEVDRNHP